MIMIITLSVRRWWRFFVQVFGWPEAPIQDVLDAVIRRCGHQPVTVDDSDLTFEDRLRENVKLLFTVVIEDDTVKSLLTTQTVDEVILHVLKISNQYERITWFKKPTYSNLLLTPQVTLI